MNDIKIKSTQDDLSLVEAIHNRFLDLCDLHKKTTGTELRPTAEVYQWIKIWRTVFQRYARSDFRHTPTEMKVIQDFAQWTVDVKRDLCKKERIVLEWKS